MSVGMGAVAIGNIPFASLIAFASRYGIDDLGEFQDFADIVGKLDRHELPHINRLANKKP